MFYFYYPAAIERFLGPANISILNNDDFVEKVTTLDSLKEHLPANSYLFYPALYSLLSKCILDSDRTSEVINAYEKLFDSITELKVNSAQDLAFVGISFGGGEGSSSTIDDIKFQVSFNNPTSVLETMLAELYVSKNKHLKKMSSSLTAISRQFESLELAEKDFKRSLEFVGEAIHIKSTFGSANDIKNALESLSERSSSLDLLEEKQGDLVELTETLEEDLREERLKTSNLQNKLDRSVHQIQVLQENIVSKHQEFQVKEAKYREDFTKQESSLNAENEQLLNELGELKINIANSEAKLKVSVLELQKLQELYEKKLLELSVIEIKTNELNKENSLLATKVFDVNKEQVELSEKLVYLNKSAEKDKKSAITKQKILEREKIRLVSRNAEISHKYSTLRYEMFLKNRELEVIQSSPFWKRSNVLRAVRSKLSRNGISESVKSDIALIATSEYFDFDWYFSTYDDVKDAGVDPAQHYLTCGAEEGRFPGPNFDGNWYLERYPDVAEANINPLLHFIKCGKREGRVPCPKMIADKR